MKIILCQATFPLETIIINVQIWQQLKSDNIMAQSHQEIHTLTRVIRFFILLPRYLLQDRKQVLKISTSTCIPIAHVLLIVDVLEVPVISIDWKLILNKITVPIPCGKNHNASLFLVNVTDKLHSTSCRRKPPVYLLQIRKPQCLWQS